MTFLSAGLVLARNARLERRACSVWRADYCCSASDVDVGADACACRSLPHAQGAAAPALDTELGAVTAPAWAPLLVAQWGAEWGRATEPTLESPSEPPSVPAWVLALDESPLLPPGRPWAGRRCPRSQKVALAMAWVPP